MARKLYMIRGRGHFRVIRRRAMEKTDGQKKLNVVVLDEDPTYLRVWEKIFNDIGGCHLRLTNDPLAAERMIKEKNVDLVISEVVLPILDGYSIADLTHKLYPDAEVVLTTSYDCDLTRFNLKNPHFSILYKPYNNIEDIRRFITHLLNNEDVFGDVSEDSYSENDAYPNVMEWKL